MPSENAVKRGILAHTCNLSAWRQLRQSDHECMVSLGCIERPCVFKKENVDRDVAWLVECMLAQMEPGFHL